jgi:ATP-dependent Clp protease ATP-binding subunit ClpA
MHYDEEGNEIDAPPLGEVEIDSLEVPPEILNALSEEAANLVTFAINDCNHGMLTDAGLLLALVAFDGKLASMILERKDLTVGAIRKDVGLRMGKQRTYFSNLVRSNASAIKIMEKAKELSEEKKKKEITPEIILYAMHDSNDAWVNLVLSSFQKSW